MKKTSATSEDSVLAQAIDPEVVAMVKILIETNSKMLDEIVDEIVAQYCGELDKYIRFIQTMLKDPNPPTDSELDDFVMTLPVLLYFTGEGQESLGIREDTAKAFKMDRYNKAFNQAAGTIQDKSATADLASQSEYLAHTAYGRAYKKIKLRMEIGNELLQSLKKVVTRRTEAMKLAGVDTGRMR